MLYKCSSYQHNYILCLSPTLNGSLSLEHSDTINATEEYSIYTCDCHISIIMTPDDDQKHFIVHSTLTANTLTLADLPVLQSKLQTVSGLWYPLGVRFQLQPNVLGGIPRVAGNDNATCLSVMLMQWLQCKKHPPTLDALIV